MSSTINDSSFLQRPTFRPLGSTKLTIHNYSQFGFDSIIDPIQNHHSADDDQFRFTMKFLPRVQAFNNGGPYIRLQATKLKKPVLAQYTISILGDTEQKLYSQVHTWKFTKENEFIFSKFISVSELKSNGLLAGDRLRLLIEVEILDHKPNPTQLALDQVTTDYANLLETGKHSDAVFIVEGKQLPVHKNILSARSSVFAAMFEYDWVESRSSRVEITDLSYEICQDILYFLYTGKVSKLNDQDNAFDLLIASDKYQLSHLKSIIEQHLSTSLTIESVVNVLLIADMVHSVQLKSNCIDYITRNAKQVMQTDGWKCDLVNEKRIDLVVELYAKVVNNKSNHQL